MKKIGKAAAITAAIILFGSALHYAQSHEQAEDVILMMSQEDYDRINAMTGGDNDVCAIAEIYMKETNINR